MRRKATEALGKCVFILTVQLISNTPAIAPATRAFPLCLGLFTGAIVCVFVLN